MKKNSFALIMVMAIFMSVTAHAKNGGGGGGGGAAVDKAPILAAKANLKAIKKNGGTKEQILAAKEQLQAIKAVGNPAEAGNAGE